LGGLEYNPERGEDGYSSVSSEFFATFLLMVVVFIVKFKEDTPDLLARISHDIAEWWEYNSLYYSHDITK